MVKDNPKKMWVLWVLIVRIHIKAYKLGVRNLKNFFVVDIISIFSKKEFPQKFQNINSIIYKLNKINVIIIKFINFILLINRVQNDFWN